MRLTITVVDKATGDATDVFVDADAAMPMRELAHRLHTLLRGGYADRPPVLYVERRPIPPDVTLHESPIREGTLLGLGSARGTAPPEPDGQVEIRVVGGHGAGTTHRLSPGEYLVGTSPECRIRLDGGPRAATRLLVTADGGCRIRAAAQVVLDQTEVDGDTPWPVGAQLTIGPVLLERVEPSRPDAAVLPSADGAGLDFNRPPRLRPKPVQLKYTLPRKPQKPEKRPIPLLILLMVPLVMAGVTFFVFQNPRFLLFALISPLMLIGNQVSTRRQGKKSYQQRLREWEQDVADVRAKVARAVLAERAELRAASPDPAATLLIATGPRQRLWERRWTDQDFLVLRVGSGDQDSKVELTEPGKDKQDTEPPVVHDVPVTIPIRRLGVFGVAGEDGADAVAGWLLTQAAALHSPSDLRICVLSGSGGGDQWAWTHFLPHTAPLTGDGLAMLGTDSESVANRVAMLNSLLAARQAAGDRGRKVAADGDPDILVVLDGARRLRAIPGVVQLLRQGPEVGIYVLCLDAEQRLLPEECQGVVVVDDDGWAGVDLGALGALDPVRPDAPVTSWCLSVARALAPFRDTGDSDEDAALPSAARLLDVLNLEPPTPDGVLAHWSLGGRSTRAVLGIGLDGAFALDIARDGPHGLIAGTTGSGKSELLQSLVAALAVANRPDEMNFVLVDYKGGSAFKDCVDLPHTVGMVTDLDAHLVERALTSLGAELRRREHVLADVGAKDIEDYQLLRNVAPLPRLLIVIDEFASMVRELPDFVKGLVNIAQRGRSLGIHLMLATQRPAGAVTADIRANTNLRIALRMTDAAESRDVIDAAESAQISISTPGRAYARLGQAALLPFQAGRVGGRRPGASNEPVRREPFLAELTWSELGGPTPTPPAQVVAEQPVSEETDLAVLVEAIGKASAELGVPAQPQPWLPALPTSLTIDELPTSRRGAVYGLVDLPAEQAQRPLVLDLDDTGHLHLIGSPRSGRSQALRTIAAALATRYSCADVHLYGMDCGNGALIPLGELPHCGAIVSRSEPERVSRLLARLQKEIAARQALLAAKAVADLAELRATGDPTPHLVLLVDRWETFLQTFSEFEGGSAVERMVAILREGASVGVHVVAAGDKSLTGSKYSSTTEYKLVLRLNDAGDYTMTGLPRKAVPEEMPSGRVLRVTDTAEAQIALLDADPSGAAQVAALRRRAADVTQRDAPVPAERRPFRIDVLPEKLEFAEAWARRTSAGSPLWALIGVGGDEVAALGPDLAVTPSFLAGGPPRSGRSTLLLSAARSLAAAGTEIVLLTPKASPLRELRGAPGIRAVFDGRDVDPEEFRAALGAVQSSACAVLVDDAELLIGSQVDSDLTTIVRGMAGEGWGLVAAGSTESLIGGMSGWHTYARRNRCGLLLSPRSYAEGELLGMRLQPGAFGGGAAPPGRGLMHLADGQLVTVQVPY